MHIDTPEIRTESNDQAFFVTGAGQNGTKKYTHKTRNGDPVDLTGMTLVFLVKTSEDALDNELDSGFPLSATIIDAASGRFNVNMSTINFTEPRDEVIVVLADVQGGTNVEISRGRAFIAKAGIAAT